MDENLSKVFHAPPVVQMAHQLIFLYSQDGDAEDQVHFHNDHQILFHLEEEGGKDEKENLCTGVQPLYLQAPFEVRLGHLCDGQQRGDSKGDKKRLLLFQ